MTDKSLEAKEAIDTVGDMVSRLNAIAISTGPLGFDVSAGQVERPIVVAKLLEYLQQFATPEDAEQLKEYMKDTRHGQPFGVDNTYGKFLQRSEDLSKKADWQSLDDAQWLLKRSLWYWLSICDGKNMTETIASVLISLGELAERVGKYEEAMDWLACAQLFYMQRDWLELKLFCGHGINSLVGTFIDNAGRICRVARRQGEFPLTIALLKETGIVAQQLKEIVPTTAHGAEHFLRSAYPPEWKRLHVVSRVP